MEIHEREKRECNIIVVGLEENSESCEKIVKRFIEEKLELNLEEAQMTQAKRIGRKIAQSTHPRPVLVTFSSIESKHLVMKNRRKLKGSSIYDLTREQRNLERKLREKKTFLSNHPDYKDKN